MISEKILNRKDYEFLCQVESNLLSFISSDEGVYQLEPMNAYYRRIVHQMATDCGLESCSIGEEGERTIQLTRTGRASTPDKLWSLQYQIEIEPIFDYGNRVYLAVPLTTIVLRKDGSFGIPTTEDREPILTERQVPVQQFRIRKNQILCPSDPEW